MGKMRKKTTRITNCGIHSQFMVHASHSTAGSDPRRRDDADREVLLGQELDGGEDPECDEQSPDEVAGAMRQDDRPDGRAGQGEDGRVAAEAPGIDRVGDLPRRHEHDQADRRSM